MTFRKFLRGAVAVVAFATLTSQPHAQQPQRFLYAALPGVGGGNNLSYGGAGILVFDIDHGHRFVRRIPLQGTAPPTPIAATGRSGRGNAQEAPGKVYRIAARQGGMAQRGERFGSGKVGFRRAIGRECQQNG